MNQPQQRQRQAVRRPNGPPPKTVDQQDVMQTTDPMAASGFIKGVSLTTQVMTNPQLMPVVQQLVEWYSNSPMCPAHARGNQGFCFWALDFAQMANLSPMDVINNSFSPDKKRVGFMSRLVRLVLRSRKAIIGDVKYKMIGDPDRWEQITGNFNIIKGDNGKYAKAAWEEWGDIEEGLGVEVTLHWVGRDQPDTYGPYFLRNMYPRFSTVWSTDPYKQLCDRVLRMVQDAVRPDLMASVQTEDEMYPIDHVGPDRAKVINDPSSNLDDFAQQHGGGEESLKRPEGRAKTTKTKSTRSKAKQQPSQTPKDEGPHWDVDEDQDQGAMSFDEDPDEGIDHVVDDPFITIWCNPDVTAHRIRKENILTALTEGMYKATNVQRVNDLYENNAHAIKLLTQEEKGKLNALMDQRADILDE